MNLNADLKLQSIFNDEIEIQPKSKSPVWGWLTKEENKNVL